MATTDRPFVTSYLGVLVLSAAVTIGIYWWVYLFRVLGRLEQNVQYQADDFSAAKARPLLGWLVFLVYAVLIALMVVLVPQMGRELGYAARLQNSGVWGQVAGSPQASIGAEILANVLSIALAGITIGIYVVMIRVLSDGQERLGMKAFDKTIA